MSKEEIRKLLGGYATNTLTESERNALFEAALDDQELFNALQQEQPLKTLLDDPVSRAQVRQALEQQPSKRPGWQIGWWAWGGAAGAVLAAFLLVVVIRQNPGIFNRQSAEVAMATKMPSPMSSVETREDQPAPPPAPKRPPLQGSASRTPGPAPLRNSPTPAAAAPAPPPIIPAPVQAQAESQPAQSQAAQSLGVQENVVVTGPPQDRTTTAPVVVKAFAAGQASLLHYSIEKRESTNFVPVSETELKNGDVVRLQVSSTVAGQLGLSRLDEAGGWIHVADLAVQANSGYTIPDQPIQVTANAQRYRLTLETSGAQPKTVGSTAGRFKSAMRAASPAQSGASIAQPGASAPAVVEITIRGNGGN